MTDFATRSRLRGPGYRVPANTPHRPLTLRREIYRQPATLYSLPPESATSVGHDCCDDVIRTSYDDRWATWMARHLADGLEKTWKATTGVKQEGEMENEDGNRPTDERIQRWSKSTLFMTLGQCAEKTADKTAKATETGTNAEEEELDYSFNTPRGVAVDPDNGDIYVADTGHDRIQRYTACGVRVGCFGSRGVGPGQFRQPTDVVVPLSGSTVVVADRLNRRIQVFSKGKTCADHKPIRTIAATGEPFSVAADETGKQIIVGTTRGTVQIYSTSSGSLERQFFPGGKDPALGGSQSLIRPIQVSTTPTKPKTVIVLDQVGGTVICCTYKGTVLHWFKPSHDCTAYKLAFSPNGLAVDQLGQIILSDGLNHAVAIFDTHGNLVRYIIEPGVYAGPIQAVAIGPEGHFIDCEFSVNGSEAHCVKVWKYRECDCHRDNSALKRHSARRQTPAAVATEPVVEDAK